MEQPYSCSGAPWHLRAWGGAGGGGQQYNGNENKARDTYIFRDQRCIYPQRQIQPTVTAGAGDEGDKEAHACAISSHSREGGIAPSPRLFLPPSPLPTRPSPNPSKEGSLRTNCTVTRATLTTTMHLFFCRLVDGNRSGRLPLLSLVPMVVSIVLFFAYRLLRA